MSHALSIHSLFCVCFSLSLRCSSPQGLIFKPLISFQVLSQNHFLEEGVSVQPLPAASGAVLCFLMAHHRHSYNPDVSGTGLRAPGGQEAPCTVPGTQ